jgi:DNA primase large subunit
MKNDGFSVISLFTKEFSIGLNDNRIHFSDYLKFAPTWDVKWKLTNRSLSDGYVQLHIHEIARLIQESIREKIYKELAYLFAPAEVKQVFGSEIAKLRSQVTQKDTRSSLKSKEIKEGNFPPCIQRLAGAVREGKNIPHVGRFTFVTFFNQIGMKTDDIITQFSTSPDFNQEKTRYQIEHITGTISGTEYTTPKCDTIRTWGFCYPDAFCKSIRHPLSYYKKKVKQ